MSTSTTVPGSETQGRPPDQRWLGWLLPIGFCVVAVGLFAGSGGPTIPVPPARAIEPSALHVAPRRTALSDPAHIMIEGVPQRCNGCHQIFDSFGTTVAARNYHQEIRLSHGMNDRCVNCHSEKDREQLELRDGTRVPYAQTPLLCAQCHGTVFRDWERGTHGKTLGSWVTQSEAQRRLSCNECHDPHSPRYPSYEPMPGPNTLRMGTPLAPSHGHSASPLQQWFHHSQSPTGGQEPHHD